METSGLHFHIYPNPDSNAMASFFMQLNLSGSGVQELNMEDLHSFAVDSNISQF